MTSVRFFPVAEQYPSRIATSSLVASHLTSGITQPKKIPIQPEGQTGKARVSHRRRETTSVALGGFLGLASFGSREFIRDQLRPDQPPVIGAQVAAGDLAISSLFDCRAALDRDWSMTRHPLTDRRRSHFKNIGKRFLTPDDFAGFLNSFHANNYSNATDYLQATLQNCLDSIAI